VLAFPLAEIERGDAAGVFDEADDKNFLPLDRMYDLYPGQKATGQLMLDLTNILDPKLDLNLMRARVGMVFQKPTPFPMAIYENIAFGKRSRSRRQEPPKRSEKSSLRSATSQESSGYRLSSRNTGRHDPRDRFQCLTSRRRHRGSCRKYR
jgi:hypothetical protein